MPSLFGGTHVLTSTTVRVVKQLHGHVKRRFVVKRGEALLTARSLPGSTWGLDGFQLVSAELVGGEWQLAVQTLATVVGCGGCGMRAELHGRRTVRVRDLPIGGRPVMLAWAQADLAV